MDRWVTISRTRKEVNIHALCLIDRVLFKGDNVGPLRSIQPNVLTLHNCQLHQSSYNIAQIRASDHRPVYATFTTEVHSIDHAKEESIRHTLTSEVLKREVNNAKGNRRPPPIPAVKKPDAMDLDKSFKELKFDASPGVAVQGAVEDTGVFKQQGSKTTAKRKPSCVLNTVV